MTAKRINLTACKAMLPIQVEGRYILAAVIPFGNNVKQGSVIFRALFVLC